MKKSLLVLLLAVLLPSLVLGWLALGSVQEQQIVLERRTAELYQKETDALATSARSLLSEQRRAFAETLRQLLVRESPAALAAHFTTSLHEAWAQPAIGFALAADGRLLAPTSGEASVQPSVRQFLADNGSFVGNRSSATAYQVPAEELNRPELSKSKSYNSKQSAPSSDNSGAEGNLRNVAPQSLIANRDLPLTWSNGEFRQFTSEGNEGVVNRFVNDRLNMIFWIRPAEARHLVFGCLLQAGDLAAQWPGLFAETPEPDFILALLDDKAHPAAVSPAGSQVADWHQPFVASQIGEALPHWEAALYLLHPERLLASARQARRNLYFLIACALGAIAIGGWVVFADTRHQLALAQKKTDFVSNVSHELKTPLTSIRMFAELMHTGRAAPERQPQYLRIIMVEAERLTRLINNVLDFARQERRQHPFEKRRFDLIDMLARIWSSQAVHLDEAGFATQWENTATPSPVMGDEDALAQVLVNLLSNAEKYGGPSKEITLRSFVEGGRVCFSVLDRGAGVPAGEAAKIFEPFYRAHDSLSSGIPGTGLGLSLASRIVREHGGEIAYAPREGGGSDFTVRLPLPSAS